MLFVFEKKNESEKSRTTYFVFTKNTENRRNPPFFADGKTFNLILNDFADRKSGIVPQINQFSSTRMEGQKSESDLERLESQVMAKNPRHSILLLVHYHY